MHLNSKMSSSKISREELYRTVLLNELVLERIFSNLNTKNLLQFRPVCRRWNVLIKPIIANEIKATFSTFDFDQDNMTKEMEHFENMRISKVLCFFHSDSDANYLINRNRFVETIKNCWKQVKNLHLDTSESDGNLNLDMISLFSAPKNLQVLRLKSAPDVFSVMQQVQKTFPSVRILTVEMVRFPIPSEEVVKIIWNCFPNLEQNTRNWILDTELLRLICKGQLSGKKLKSFKTVVFSVLDEFVKAPANFLPSMTKLEIGGMEGVCQEEADKVTEILKTFSATLESVILLGAIDLLTGRNPPVITIPPLPKLRKLVVGLPSYSEEEPSFFWDFGKSMAKDFPLLEHFIVKPRLEYEDATEEDCFNFVMENYPFEDSCLEIWKSFVPFGEFENLNGEEKDSEEEMEISDEEDEKEKKVELSPLPFLKLVDVAIPSHWIGSEGSREWGKEFLDVYLKLYGNAGKESIQKMIDWLE